MSTISFETEYQTDDRRKDAIYADGKRVGDLLTFFKDGSKYFNRHMNPISLKIRKDIVKEIQAAIKGRV